ncbi:MAG TPA: hypothetical protein VMU15_01505 [Anaeromyxobacter sp.]|nr:hypothetical protein [Anaeromyxobacter sp.]
MCCINASGRKLSLFSKATLDPLFRETFLADPIGVARDFGLSPGELDELRLYDARKLRATFEGPPSRP